MDRLMGVRLLRQGEAEGEHGFIDPPRRRSAYPRLTYISGVPPDSEIAFWNSGTAAWSSSIWECRKPRK